MRPARKRAAAVRSLPAATLLSLSAPLLDDIASRAVQLGAGEALSLTCRALSLVVLQHAPALSIELGQANQSRLLAPRVVSALQTRTCKLTLTLRQPPEQESRQYMEELTTALAKLGSIPAVRRCELVSIIAKQFDKKVRKAPKYLDCTPGLAQRLLNSFPRLTALAIGGYSTPCSSLASMFSHPQLALQLQQLDLTGSTILHAKKAEESEQGLKFHGLKLKQLSLDVHETKLMPHLQPLAPHLTQLCVGVKWRHEHPHALALLVGALPQLQVLTVMQQSSLQDVLQLLPGLPRLHTLQLPQVSVDEQEQLDALLAATQLTSIQLASITDLTSQHTDVACSWQRLELTVSTNFAAVCCLPLHSLTQPLVLGELYISAPGHYGNTHLDGIEPDDEDEDEDEDEEDYDGAYELVVDGLHNLLEACQVPVRIGKLTIAMENVYCFPCFFHVANNRLLEAPQLLSLLQPLGGCVGRVKVVMMKHLGLAVVPALARLCEGCTDVELCGGSLTPCKEFWHQLVQLMPSVPSITFRGTAGSCSVAMRQLLWRLSKQAWAQGLDITIMHSAADLPKEWQRCNRCLGSRTPGRFRARYVVAERGEELW
ncbi:hypothetical protein V8C86DRAFT_1520931 [Haematococcus lacustris]